MQSLLKRWQSSWDQWVGDRDLELTIRGTLSDHGFGGRTAVLRRVRLEAIERPGWIQIYSFSAEVHVRKDLSVANATSSDPSDLAEPTVIYGVVIDDGRRNARSEVYLVEADRDNQLDEWATGLIRRGQRGEGYANRLLVAAVATGLAFAIYASLR